MTEAILSRRKFAQFCAAAGLAVSTSRRLLAQTVAADSRDPLTIAFDDLIAANRILASEGVIDAFGHVSCRHPLRPAHFLMSRARAPALVEIADIIEFDGEGNPINAAGRRPYAERFIHSAIYEARADVHAVVHDHSAEIIPFGISTTPLRAVSHVGGIIGGTVPVWDIAEVVGPKSNLMVTRLEIGRSLARKLGGGTALLMRGHGAAIASQSIRRTTIAAITLNSQARMLQNAIALGTKVQPLSPGEIAETGKIFTDETPGDAVGRTWEYWCVRAGVPFHPKGA